MNVPPARHSTQPAAVPATSAARARSPSGTADPDARAIALRHFPSYVRLVGVAALGLVLDVWSKHWAFHTLGQGHRPLVIVPHVLEFQTMLNSGALFGIGGGQTALFLIASACALLLVFWMFSQTSPRRWTLQVALGAILAGALGNMYDRVVVKLLEDPWFRGGRPVYMVKTAERPPGVLVQEYPPGDDRSTHFVPPNKIPGEAGFVRDFIKIPTTVPAWKWIPEKLRGKELWPWVFNVADMLLVGGVGILAVHLWRERKGRPGREPIAVDSHGSGA